MRVMGYGKSCDFVTAFAPRFRSATTRKHELQNLAVER
jgi:hypothetical protein